MANRPFLKPHYVITNGSMATSLTSQVTIKNQIPLISYSVSFTGTPTGVFSIEVSDDYALAADGTVSNPGTWTTLPLSSPITASGSSGNAFMDITTGAYAIRLVYTRTSGVGTLNAVITGMVL